MSWFKRIKGGITTSTREKKESPEGLWTRCPSCKNIVSTKDHIALNYVCSKCNYHHRIGSHEYFDILFDNHEFLELNAGLSSADPLGFLDTKKYADRLQESEKKTGLKDALRTGHGTVEGNDLVVACMDFAF